MNVEALLEQRPVPSIWPDDSAFNAHVRDDDTMCRLWILALLHHPEPEVVAQCLRSRHLAGWPHGEDVAYLLMNPSMAAAAAAAVWRMTDSGVRTVLNIILSRGLEPSGYPPRQVGRAIELLRSACPQDRRGFFDQEIAAKQ